MWNRMYFKSEKLEYEYYFYSECYKKKPYPTSESKGKLFNKTMDINTTSSLRNHLTF